MYHIINFLQTSYWIIWKTSCRGSCKQIACSSGFAFHTVRQHTFLMMKAKWAWAAWVGRDADPETATAIWNPHMNRNGHMIWFIISFLSFHSISVWDFLPNLAGTVDVACRGGPAYSWYVELALILTSEFMFTFVSLKSMSWTDCWKLCRCF